MTTSNSVAVKLVSDGTFLLDGGPMFGSVPKILWEKNVKPDRKNRVRLGLNSLLIKTPHANILVDAGIGNKSQKSLEKCTVIHHQSFYVIYATRG